MSRCYMYVVDRDFGFAPNPFHGRCTLATCKPNIRTGAAPGDWVIGMGGARLAATGRCIYAMRVTEAMSFDEYWVDVSFRDKRPVRNGSSKMMVGDNIYHRDSETCTWLQADSHHSNPDGTPNPHNVANDTRINRVLISEHFFYFGRAAPLVPTELLDELGYRNVRNYRMFAMGEANDVIEWLHTDHRASVNLLLADPYDFESSAQRYSAHDNRIR